MIFFSLHKSNMIIHLRPLIHGLHEEGLPVALLVESDVQKLALKEEFGFAKFFLHDEIPSIDTPGVTISASLHSAAPKHTFHLNTLHYQPVKYWRNASRLLVNFDGFLCWGPFQEEYIRHLYTGTGLVSPLFFQTGCAMLDKLFDGSVDRSAEAERRGLNPDFPTVLYAPSWNPGLSLRAFGNEILGALAAAPQDLNILLRLHPASLFSKLDKGHKRFSGGVDWAGLIAALFADRKHMHNCSLEPDAAEALILSDHVITDYSSLAWDALALDRNVFHIDCPDWPHIAAENRLFGKPRPTWTLNNAFLNAGVGYGNGRVAVADLPELLNQLASDSGFPARRVSAERLLPRLLHAPGQARQKTVAIVKDLYRSLKV